MLNKKKKLPSIKSLRNKLDYTFNLYIRTRDGKCILCGSEIKLQCSHYYGKKARPALRWDEINAHAMCNSCHWKHHHGAEPDYSLWMFEQNGMSEMKKLKEFSFNKAYPYTKELYLSAIEYWKTKIARQGKE